MNSFEKFLEDVSNFDFKKLNPLYQGFFLMLGFAITVSTCSYFSNESRISKEIYKNMFEENFSGLIVKKYLDKRNHMSHTFQLNDSSEVYGYSFIWEKTEVGDSLVKKANSRFVKIFKKDTTIVFDMDTAFKYHDTLPEK
ncbi:hypothetical protein [Flavobacterium sp. H4147]|uniref:hypothetical protein n=1 Tax=Flavobacterium sp. H4147 TaxID=3034149 RepID=UPI0023EDC4CE|nr:hypothetical protein [Flavobacterium sp. H4147]